MPALSANTLVNAIDRRFTPAGRVVLVATAFAAGFGVDTSISSAYQFFGLGCGLLLVAFVGARRTLVKPLVERRSSSIAAVGVPFSYEIIIHNTGDVALEGYALRDELSLAADLGTPAKPRAAWHVRWSPRALLRYRGSERRWRRGTAVREVPVPTVPAHGQVRVALSFTPARRGAVKFGLVRFFKADGLGLARRMTTLIVPGRLIVLPERFTVAPLRLPGTQRRHQGGQAHSGRVGHAEEFLGLRDYRPGDSLKSIQWKSWARLGRPIVREFEDETYARHALVVDTAVGVDRAPVLEASASVAASLAASLNLDESLLDLIMIDERIFRFTAGRGVGEIHALLEMIAVMRASGEDAFTALAANVLKEAMVASSLVLVLAKWDAARATLVHALRQRGAIVKVIVMLGESEPIPNPMDKSLHLIRVNALAAGLAAL